MLQNEYGKFERYVAKPKEQNRPLPSYRNYHSSVATWNNVDGKKVIIWPSRYSNLFISTLQK